jgi:hypothetical protein
VAGIVVAIAAILYGCGGGGAGSETAGSGGGAGGGGAPSAPVSFPINGFADGGGGTVIVVSANSLTPGAIVIISGTLNYNGTFTVLSAAPDSFVIAATFVGDDATGFWQAGGGLLAGCTTTGATGAIQLPDLGSAGAVSRFSGVAPLAVFFDVSGTATTPATPRPFHDLGFAWDFGDSGPSAGTWSTGSRPGVASRNRATGPVAAHVYMTPGTYTVTLVVTDGSNTVTNSCIQIAVQDPDVVFAGANTICVGASSPPVAGSGGCPAGALVQQTSDFSVVMGLATAGKRVLLRRGDTWTAPGGASVPRLSSNGPGIVGAFGAGAAPLVQSGPPPGNTVLAISGPTTPNIRDWRIMDLEFDGLSGVNSNGVIGAGGAQQITFVRMRIRDISNGIQFSNSILDLLNSGGPPGGHQIYDQIAIVDSDIRRIVGGPGGNGMFLMARRLAAQGNFVEDTTAAEHVMRVQYVSGGVIQANDLGLPATLKHVLTLRAVNDGTGGVTAPNRSEKAVISDNLFRGGLAAQIVNIQPSGPSEDQRIRDIIVDGNLFRSGASAQAALLTSADEVTVRNNIFDMTGGTAFNCITHRRLGVEPAHSEIRTFNNTCFSNSAGTGALRVVSLDSTNTNVTIRNNLGYAPNLTGASVLLLDGGSTGVSGGGGTFGNSSDFAIKNTSPNFANGSGTFANATDFAVTAGSYAIDGGVAVPVFTDFFRAIRPQGAAHDIGAAEQ